MKHDMERVDLGLTSKFHRQLCARCTCGWLTDVVDNPNKVDDEIQAHQRAVIRERIDHGPQRPALKTTLKHYERMAAHPASTVREKTLWETLAEEVRVRIAQTTVDNTLGQDSLFDDLEES